MINHHPPLELLFDYAAGATPEPVALIVATHAALCGDCAKSIGGIEAVGGALLETVEPIDISEDALEAVMMRLDEPLPASVARERAVDAETAAVVPEPLLPYIARGLAHLAWKSAGRMAEEARLPLTVKGFKAALMRLKPGAEMPIHTHRGSEFTLVLAGGYKDEGKQFLPGDFDFKDASHEHRPIVDTDGPCLCLIVLDAPVKLTGGFGRLVNPFLRI
jgi:putative transcriptional regulator